MNRADIIKAVAVTAELCGRVMSDAAARVFVADLERYPVPAVLDALTRCRREVRGALTLADVISRLEDGRPGPEEAWALMPVNEGVTVVWTEEMRLAFAAAGRPIARGDLVAARMAFKELYSRLLDHARNAGDPARWSVSLGHDPHGRDGPLIEAMRLGRLPARVVQLMLPHLDVETGRPHETLKKLLTVKKEPA